MLKLMYITNRLEVARAADRSGIDRIFIDLEKKGKKERQRGWHSLISNHNISDIPLIKEQLNNSKLLVRINPINSESEEEIEKVLSYRPDVIMLPYFKTAEEVKLFVDKVGGRCTTNVLLETKEAVENIDDILSVGGIDEVHIGLNDLSHSYRKNFLFEMVSCGLIDYIVEKIQQHNIINYGFGGIARIGYGLIPAEDVIKEHYRLKSNCVILSRAFCNLKDITDEFEIEKIFKKQLERIRKVETEASLMNDEMREFHKNLFVQKVNDISKNL